MKIVFDNNLPRRMAAAVSDALSGMDVAHLSELNASDWDDSRIRERWVSEFIVWITRDEDFWTNAPAKWAVIWVSCHNPKLAFLRDRVAPVIAQHLKSLKPGARLLITQDFVLTV